MYAARAGPRKPVLPKAGGPELRRAVGATDTQRYHTIRVFPWSRTFPRSPQGTPPRTSWPGVLQLRSGLLPPLPQISCTSRLLSSSSVVCRGTAPQMRHSRKRPFHAPIGIPGCKAAHKKSDRTRFTRTKKRGCAYIRPHQLDLVVVSNDGALRLRRPLGFAYGGAGGSSQGETGDFLSIMTIYSARPQERPMRTHRFGRKIKLPATIAIKHQIRMRMAEYEIKKVEEEARAEAFRGQTDDNASMSSSSVTPR